MNHPALDAYLDELLDFNVDAVAPAPVAANAPVMGVVDEASLDSGHVEVAEVELLPPHAGGGWEGVSGAQAPGSEPAMPIDPGLLAELDSDPLFAGQTTQAEDKPLPLLAGGEEGCSRAMARIPTNAIGQCPMAAGREAVSGAQAPGSEPSGAVDCTPPQPHGHQAQPDGVRHDARHGAQASLLTPAGRGGSHNALAVESVATAIDPGLLAELDSDPLFAAVMASSLPPTAPESLIDPGLLAELDSDPLFAAVMASSASAATPESLIDPGLLAELDSDPLFAALMAEPAAPSNVPVIDPALLAELDSDPLFAALMAEPVAPASAPAAPPTRAATPRPAPARNTMPQADPRSGLRPIEVTPPALTHSVTATHRWLRVAVGDDSYAVELLRVQEVGRTVPIVAMRGAAPSVLGAMNLRGRIVPVFDLGLWLGTGRVTPDERARIVVVERDNELIGALVTAVDDVVTLGPDRIEPPLMASPSRAIVGVARVVAKPTVLLDANALFG